MDAGVNVVVFAVAGGVYPALSAAADSGVTSLPAVVGRGADLPPVFLAAVAVDEPAATVLVPAGVLTFTVAGVVFSVPPVAGAFWVGEVDMTVGLGAGVLIFGALETA